MRRFGNIRVILAALGKFDKLLFTDFLVPQLRTPEDHVELYLIALFEEFERVTGLEVNVVLLGIGAYPYGLGLHVLGLFLRFFLLLLLLVLELAIVQKAAYWRFGVWRDFDDVKSRFLGILPGLINADDTNLFAVLINETNFLGANGLVNAIAF